MKNKGLTPLDWFEKIENKKTLKEMLDELNYDNKKIVDLVPFKTNIGTDYREQLKQQDLMKSNKIKWEKNNITKNDEIEQHTVIGC